MVKYTVNGTPSEDDEEQVLANFCDAMGWMHTHFSNETYTTSWKQKNKMKKMGVHSGLPDHIVLVPSVVGLTPVYIEMKRKKGGVISDTQYKWIKALREAGQHVAVCEGNEEAIEFLQGIQRYDHEIVAKYYEKFDKKYEKWAKKQEKRKNDCPF